MLQQIRARSGSLVIKIILSIIGASFVVFGIADVVRIIMATPPVAKMGRLRVSFDEYYHAYERYKAHLMTSKNKSEAVLTRAADKILESLISSKIMDFEPERLGLVASQSVVQSYIRSIPYFQKDGQFDGEKFAAALATAGLNPKAFVHSMHNQLMQQQFVIPIVSGMTLNQPYIDLLTDVMQRKRCFEIVEAPASIDQKIEVSEEKLVAWLKGHTEEYDVPEQRDLKILVLDHNAIAATIELQEPEIDAELRAREIKETEQRDVHVFMFDAKSDADDAIGILLREKSIAAVKKAFSDVKVSAADMSKLSGIAFEILSSRDEWVPWGPVEMGRRYALYVVTKIVKQPGKAATRDEVVSDLKRLKLPAEVERLKNKIDDALASDAPMDKVAAEFGGKVIFVKGVDPSSIKPALANFEIRDSDADAITEQALALEKDNDSPFIDVSGKSFVVRVENVYEKHAPDLESVREKVQADYIAHETETNMYKDLSNLFGDVHDDPSKWHQIIKAQKCAVKTIKVSHSDLTAGDDELSKIFVDGVSRLMLQRIHSVSFHKTKIGKIVAVFVESTSNSVSDALNPQKIEITEKFRKSCIDSQKEDAMRLVADSVQESYKVNINNRVKKMASQSE
jgi:peptidyl-prolyl cis-trans isomerase D